MTKEQRLAHFALFAVAIIYSANYLIAKWVMPYPISADAFIVLRVSGAALLFWILLGKNRRLPEKKDVLLLAFCGLTGVATNQLFFFNGLALTTPVNASIIMTTNPILVGILFYFGIKKVPSWKTFVGIAMGTLGAIGIILLRPSHEQTNTHLYGDIFILINSLSYGIYLTTVPRLMKKYSPLFVVTWVFTFGLLFVMPFGWSELSAVPWFELSALHWFSLTFIVVAVTFLTYLFNIFALKHVTPTITSVYIYLQPLLAGIFAYLFAGVGNQDHTSSITWAKIIFALFIFSGVYLVSKEKAKS
jgi:drug/metabolite transporter (DMT)-like permease